MKRLREDTSLTFGPSKRKMIYRRVINGAYSDEHELKLLMQEFKALEQAPQIEYSDYDLPLV